MLSKVEHEQSFITSGSGIEVKIGMTPILTQPSVVLWNFGKQCKTRSDATEHDV